MGCPVPKIVNNGEGSALMRDPKLAGEIIRRVAAASRKPGNPRISPCRPAHHHTVTSGFSQHPFGALGRIHVPVSAGAMFVGYRILYFYKKENAFYLEKSTGRIRKYKNASRAGNISFEEKQPGARGDEELPVRIFCSPRY